MIVESFSTKKNLYNRRPNMSNDWIKNYSRLLVDNHIAECDEKLMSKYSPENYAEMMASAGISSTTRSF